MANNACVQHGILLSGSCSRKMPLCPIDRKLAELTFHQTAEIVENGAGLQGDLVVGGLVCIGSVPPKPGHLAVQSVVAFLGDFSESYSRVFPQTVISK